LEANRTRSDRLALVALAAAMAVAALLILRVNRGSTFWFDELAWFATSPELDPELVFQPHFGNLIVTARLAYAALLEAFGADYGVYRLIGAATVVGTGGVFYALARRRVGAVAALAPTALLLFLGSSWQMVVLPGNGIAVVLALGAGLGALLALERGDRGGDAAAGLLLVFAVVTFSASLAFVVGAAVRIALEPGWRRRLWVPLAPVALYGAWWLYARGLAQSPSDQTTLSNLLLIPGWAADSLAACLTGIAGLDYDFRGANAKLEAELGWGRVLAVPAVAALVWRLRAGAIPASLWAAIAVAASYWAAGAMAAESAGRSPDQTRYIYISAIAVLLVAVEAGAGIRFTRNRLLALFGVAGACLAGNVAMEREGGVFFRGEFTPQVRAQLTALHLAGDRGDPDFDPIPLLNEDVTPYLSQAWDTLRAIDAPPLATVQEAIDRYDYPVFTGPELRLQAQKPREEADTVLARALGVTLEAATEPPRTCAREAPEGGEGTTTVALPPGGAILQAGGGAPAEVKLERFSDTFPVSSGSIVPGRPAQLVIPEDDYEEPWSASVAAPSVLVCPLPSP
jgi:hypothetical protein